MNRHIDIGSFIVAIITLGLFVAALFAKGITHDLFLESGVFLISVKIIMMTYKNSIAVGQLGDKLDNILATLTGKSNSTPNNAESSQDRRHPEE
jgi:hypothetical protein